MQYYTAIESWVVFEMTSHNLASGKRAVCEQDEWDAMKLAEPDRHILVQDHIPTEGAAERLARGTSGDPKLRPKAAPLLPTR